MPDASVHTSPLRLSKLYMPIYDSKNSKRVLKLYLKIKIVVSTAVQTSCTDKIIKTNSSHHWYAIVFLQSYWKQLCN